MDKVKDKLAAAAHAATPSSSGTSTPTQSHNNQHQNLAPDSSHSAPRSSSHGRSASVSSTGSTTVSEKYLLRVTAGPSYDYKTHKLVRVNEDEACSFENEFMSVKVKVRIKDFKGLPRSCPPDHTYFTHPTHTHDRYSISFSFTPKRDIPCAGTVWGNDFPHPVRDRLPPGFNTAFNIVKRFIDPGLECDAYADEPWLLGPSLSCWFSFLVGEKAGEGKASEGGMEGEPELQEIIEEGGVGSGAHVRKELGMPDTGDKRRKWALTASNRERVVFERGRTYQADFYNPYLDFSNFSLRLPGFSLNVLKYIDDKTHKLRYVFKNRDKGEVYFVVVFSLLFGDELVSAVEEDERGGGDVDVGRQEAEAHERRKREQEEAEGASAPAEEDAAGAKPQSERNTTHSTHEDDQGNVFHDEGVD